ncbi:LysR family transcriptional regulator [Paenibacillus sp. sgz500958]|uniref:LysR family transcriptional regulator n=1 Tax=Paenibacillus sp. sgz500958 TaxID=3242475 RepID=UPI0036D327AC
MNLRHLQYFRVIAQIEHLTQAAVKLSISQPSLSHAMSELEKELGTQLFEKQGRNIRLTKYGRHFLGYVNRALDELDNGERQLREMTSPGTGKIDLAFTYMLGSHFAPAFVQAFTTDDNHKSISLSFHQGNAGSIIQGLKNDSFDLAFCPYMDNEPDIDFVPLMEEELVLIVPSNHELAKFDSIDLKDAAAYPMVCFNQTSGLRPMIDDLFDQVDLVPNIACEIEDATGMAGLVAVGYGIGIMPRIDILGHFDIKALTIAHPHYQQFICLASVRNRYMSPAARMFRNFVIHYKP